MAHSFLRRVQIGGRRAPKQWALLGLISLGLVHCNALTGLGDLDFSRPTTGDKDDDDGDGLGGMGGEAPVLSEPPEVESTDPADEEQDVDPSATITVQFSEALDGSTVTGENLFLENNGVAVAGSVSYENGRGFFTPAAPLSLLSEYELRVTTGIEDTTGTKMPAPYTSTFQTRDGAWDPEVEYAPNSGFPSFGSDALGNMLVVYSLQNGDGYYDIYGRWYRADDTWDEPVLLESLVESCGQPKVAVAQNGDALLSFHVTVAETSEIWARRFVDGAWETTEQRVENVLDPSNTAYSGSWPLVAGDRFLVGWIRENPYTYMTENFFRTYLEFTSAGASGSWDAVPFIIDSANTATSDEQLRSVITTSSSPDGGAAVAYGRYSSTDIEPRFSMYSTTTQSWTLGARLRLTGDVPSLSSGNSSAVPSIVRRAGGDAMAVWSSQVDSTELSLVGSYYDKANGWSVPVIIDASASNAFTSSTGLSASPDGFVVTWRQGDETKFNVLMSSYSVDDGTWSTPVLVSDGESSAYWGSSEIWVDPQGNAMITWSQGGDLDVPPDVFYARYNHLTETLSAPARLSTIDQPYQGASLVGSQNGRVYALLYTGWYDGPYLNFFMPFH